MCTLLLGFTGGRIALYGDSNCLDSSHMQRGLDN
jgi:hypothetical protein